MSHRRCVTCGASVHYSATRCRDCFFQQIDATVAERFWAKTRPEGDCLVWNGWIREAGGRYGLFSLRGKVVRANRLAYELTHGPIASGLVVMHTCDNPPCVKPEHLRLGTQADNWADMRAKGRAVDQKRRAVA